MSDATVLHTHPGSGVAEQIATLLAEVPDLEVEQCRTVADAEERLRDRDVDCLVAACDLRDSTGAELVRSARRIVPNLGCVLYGAERPTIDASDPERSITEFVPTTAEDAVERVVDLAGATARARTQTTYPLPDEERDRLESLERYDVQGDEVLPELQDIVDRTATELDVPQATINVVGEGEQRFAVCHDEDWAPIPRQDSICTYAILDDDPTVVPDAAEDPRFREKEVFADFELRSYAAAPIEAETGCPIGTLCVYDDQPDRFGGTDAACLQSLAREAAAVIASRRTEEEIER